MLHHRRALVILIACGTLGIAMRAQEPARLAITASDYARGEKFLAPALTNLVVGGSVAATWMDGDRFWYKATLADGSTQTIVVDPARKTRTVCTSNCPSAPANAIDNVGWSASDRAILKWSPDSKKIATQQQDERNVGEMYLVNTMVGHPTLRVSKFPLPGDAVMAMVHRLVFDVASGRMTRLTMPPLLRQKPERSPDARARHDGHQRAAVSDDARRRCADQCAAAGTTSFAG